MSIPNLIPNQTPEIYEFTNKDIILNYDGTILLHFPYLKNTFWTHFEYSNTTNLKIKLLLVTSDRYEYEILPEKEIKEDTWYDTKWPFPSLNTQKDHCGIYLQIYMSLDSFNTNRPSIKLLGFRDLFPDVENYLLISSLNTYQFIISNYEGEELEKTSSSIFNIENFTYIKDILPKSVSINLLSYYI